MSLDVARSTNINYPHLSGQELQGIVHKANLHFFLSPKFIFKNMIRLKNPVYIFEVIKANLKKLFK